MKNISDKYNQVIFPFLIGDDVNTNPLQSPSRYIVNFFDWDLEKCSLEFPFALQIINERVRPERAKNNDKRRREIWWQYSRPTSELYSSIKNNDYILVIPLTTKYYGFCFVDKKSVFANSLVVLSISTKKDFSIVQSTIHTEWSAKYTSTMGSVTLRYTPTNSFETFPFPQNLTASQEQELEEIGEAYHEHRRRLMLKMQLGLTKTYNAFHAREINAENLTGFKNLLGLDKKAIEKQYGKEVWNLWNHLQKTEGVCSFEEAIAGIIELRRLHVLMDEAVLEAYGWDLPLTPSQGGGKSVTQGFHAQGEGTKSGIALRHDFYEVDYLPENDRVRYTIHPEARKEILKRLLELNHKIHAEEVEMGMWEKKKTPAKKASKSTAVVKEPEVGYGNLFDGMEA